MLRIKSPEKSGWSINEESYETKYVLYSEMRSNIVDYELHKYYKKICWLLDATQQFVREPRRNIYKYIKTYVQNNMQRWLIQQQQNNTKNEVFHFQVVIKRNWKKITKMYNTINFKKKTHPLDASI